MRFNLTPQGNVGSDAGEKLLGLERLGDVIDRAEAKRAHFVERVFERGQKDDRNRCGWQRRL